MNIEQEFKYVATGQEIQSVLSEQEMTEAIEKEPHKWYSQKYGGIDYRVKDEDGQQLRYFHRASHQDYVIVVTKEEKETKKSSKSKATDTDYTEKDEENPQKKRKINPMAYRYGNFEGLYKESVNERGVKSYRIMTPAEIAQVYMDNFTIHSIDDNYYLYDYYLKKHQKFKMGNFSVFADVTQLFFDNSYRTNDLRNVCTEIKHKINVMRRPVKYNYGYLQFDRMLLDLDSLTLCAPNPGIHTPIFFDFKLDLDVDTSEVEAYAKTVFPEDYLTVQEFCGTTLDSRIRPKKVLLASGVSGGGRSHFFSMIKETYNKNATVKGLSKLCDETQRFKLRWLEGSLFNYADDVSKLGPKMHDMFKHLVGGLILDVEVKGGDEGEIPNFTKHILSMNGHLKLSELDSGVLNKLLYVDSPNAISADAIKRFDIETFAKTDTAKSAVIKWLIEGCKRYREQGGFTPTNRQDYYMEKTKRSAQIARDYFDDLLEIAPEKAVIREPLCLDYRDYCKKFGGKMLTNREVDEVLSSLFPLMENKRVSVKESTGSRQPYVYKGIAYRDVDGIGRTNYMKSGQSQNGGESYEPEAFLTA